MIKKIMVVFFAAFAIAIVLSVIVFSGKMTLLPSPDGKTIYELRVQDGKLQHALRHGGVQIFSWSDIVLTNEKNENFAPSQISVERSNAKTGEFEIGGFPGNIRLFVRVTDTFVASAFRNLPDGGKIFERVEIVPEKGALGARFSEASVAGLPPRQVARPFVFIAPKADEGDTFLIYNYTELKNAGRPKFDYAQADLQAVNFLGETTYIGEDDGILHVLYFSDSPVLLREIYDAGIPAEPFPTLISENR